MRAAATAVLILVIMFQPLDGTDGPRYPDQRNVPIRRGFALAASGGSKVDRRLLSGNADDWEPSVALGGDNSVHIIATRNLGGQPTTNASTVIWSSYNGGKTFGLATETVAEQGFEGDARVKADQQGNVYLSFISVIFDPITKRPDITKGGLVVAISRDRGKTFQSKVVSPITSAGDKPELAVSADGRDIYVVFMGPALLDVVASHDSGVTWERHTIDSARMMYWPMSIALCPNGNVYFTVGADRVADRNDPKAQRPLRLWRSTDKGATWNAHIFSVSTGAAALPGSSSCPHSPHCPPTVAGMYGWVAVDGRNRVYLAYTEQQTAQLSVLKFSRSDDDGATWSEPRLLSKAPRPRSGDEAAHYYPMIAASGKGLVYAVWADDRTGPLNIWAKRSGDGGSKWSAEVRLSREDREGITGFYGDYGGVAIGSRGALHVAWGEGMRRLPGATGGEVKSGPAGGTWYARWDGR
jgi:hypothetical protein